MASILARVRSGDVTIPETALRCSETGCEACEAAGTCLASIHGKQ
jgi:hypothetical protein